MRIIGSFLITLAVALTAAQPQYEVVDLTKVYGAGFEAVGINDAGAIGGNFFGRACIAYNGKLEMLPTFKGNDWRLMDFAEGNDALGSDYGGFPRSLFYDGATGAMVDIGVPGGKAFTAARGINNLNGATGQVFGGKHLGFPFVWEQGVGTQYLEPSGIGRDVNDSWSVVGAHGVLEAGIWIGGVLQDLHPLWAVDSEGYALNEQNEGVGRAFQAGVGYRGLLWRNGKATDLGSLGTQNARGLDINNSTQVVGSSTNEKGIVEGFLWEDGTMYALEDLVAGGTVFQIINSATSINNSGQVLASGYTGSSNPSLLFKPVPEPSTLFGIGALVAGFWGTKICRDKRQRRENSENTQTFGGGGDSSHRSHVCLRAAFARL